MQDITVLKITTYAFVHSCLFLSDFAVHWTDNFWTLSSFFISTEKTKKAVLEKGPSGSKVLDYETKH